MAGRTDYFEFFLANRHQHKLSPNPLFDGDWYIGKYPDLHGKVPDPLDHYLTYGIHEGRSPGPLFDAPFYSKLYRLLPTGVSPLAHYTRENSASFPNPIFDGGWYLATYPDVSESGLTPIAHYLLVGANKGYNPSPMFDTDWYKNTFRNRGDLTVDPLSHYLNGADRIGYDPSVCFNSIEYLKRNPDVFEAKINALAHFLTHGFHEGRLMVPSDYRVLRGG